MENVDVTQNKPQAVPIRARTLPLGIAELTTFYGPLPPWYRYDVGAREPETTTLRAFEMLVSAACYLANRPDPSEASDGEACVLLKNCARGLRDEVAEMSNAPEEIESLIWQDKQIRWKRHHRLHAAAQQPFPLTGGGLIARWLSRWRGTPTVVAL